MNLSGDLKPLLKSAIEQVTKEKIKNLIGLKKKFFI